jgi:hypothetical protein
LEVVDHCAIAPQTIVAFTDRIVTTRSFDAVIPRKSTPP